MANDLIPVVLGKAGGAAIEFQEVSPGNQLGSQWLAQPGDYIGGMLLEWVAANSLRVTAGACSIPGIGTINYNAPVTKSGLSLGSGTFYHLYSYLNGAAPDIEITSTVPAAPYIGRSRTKNGDSTRRYIGSVLTNASAGIVKFMHNSGQILYTEGVSRILQAGATPDFLTASLAAQVPVTSRLALVAMTNSHPTAPFRIRPVGFLNAVNSRMYGIPGGSFASGPLPLTDTQTYEYQVDANGSGALDVLGYFLER